jgi:hypothetical protein
MQKNAMRARKNEDERKQNNKMGQLRKVVASWESELLSLESLAVKL